MMNEKKDVNYSFYYYNKKENNAENYCETISTEQKIINMKLLGVYKKIYDISSNLKKISLIEEEIYKRYNVITEDDKILQIDEKNEKYVW